MKRKTAFEAALEVRVSGSSLRTVAVKDIDTRGVKLPARDDPKVVALVQSIGEIGQLAPILVAAGNKLISGRHRFVAHQVLKLSEIDVKTVDLDELGVRLARIDENLVRQTFTALERADALEERQRIYEAMHPTAKHGGAPGKKGGGKSKDETVSSFAKDTADKTGASERAVQLYVQAAKNIDPEVKKTIAKTPVAESITELTKLARMAPEEQRKVAAMVFAAPEKTSVKGAVKRLKKDAAVRHVRSYRPPVGSYAVQVADPSWPFDDPLDGSDEARGGVDYAPQTEEQIIAMQPGSHATPDCALWLWVTNTHLMNGMAARVLAAWGFVAKSLWTWRKVDSKGAVRLGTGHYGQNCTEHVILAIRGKPVMNADGEPNIFDAPRTSRHSEKPARFFEIVERVTPCAPEARIELNAITERKGWVTSGSEQQATARAKRGGPPAPIDPGGDEEAEFVETPPPPGGFTCQSCGHHEPKWLGKCPKCKTWGGLVEAARTDTEPAAKPALPSITWRRVKREQPVLMRGEGRLGQYEIKRQVGGFVWSRNSVEPHLNYKSAVVDSVESAQASADSFELAVVESLESPSTKADEPTRRTRKKLIVEAGA